jgi:cell wall-associated NlpC family hydrolase
LLAYRELFGKQLPRTVQEQVRQGTAVDRDFLQPGDLVFFRTGMYQKHVGIYLEDDLFIHASRSSGVRVSRLNDNYWQERFWQAKRL